MHDTIVLPLCDSVIHTYVRQVLSRLVKWLVTSFFNREKRLYISIWNSTGKSKSDFWAISQCFLLSYSEIFKWFQSISMLLMLPILAFWCEKSHIYNIYDQKMRSNDFDLLINFPNIFMKIFRTICMKISLIFSWNFSRYLLIKENAIYRPGQANCKFQH